MREADIHPPFYICRSASPHMPALEFFVGIYITTPTGPAFNKAILFVCVCVCVVRVCVCVCVYVLVYIYIYIYIYILANNRGVLRGTC